MEVVVFGAVLTTFLPKLWDVIQDNHKMRCQVEAGIHSIKLDLGNVSARISSPELQRRSTDEDVSEVIGRARAVAQETEYYICRYAYQDHAHVPASPRLNCEVLALTITGLKKKMEAIIDELNKLKPEPKASAEEPQDPQSGEEDPVVFGLDVPILDLQGLLGCTPTVNAGSPSKGKLKVISIVGFGGSGKTRLAQKVCKATSNQFNLHAWVSMGKRNTDDVLDEMLTSLSKGHPIPNGKNVTEKLQGFLGKKRYLIVVDDVRRISDWNNLKKAFPDSDVGSRIIVTTTSQPVASKCCFPDGHEYPVSTLCRDDSHKLFCNTLYGEPDSSVPEEYSSVTKICDGLPLALIESAISLEEKQPVQDSDCKEAIRNLCVIEMGSNGTPTRMQWVLMNKYSALTSYGVRACLLYFHMFPVDTQTKIKSLTRRWLAEELMQAIPKCTGLEIASQYLKTLVGGNIIRQIQHTNNGTVKSCRLPGMMHEFISLRSISENFVTFSYYQVMPVEPKYVRRLSLHGGLRQYSECIKKVELYLLRTLSVSGEACKRIMDFSQYKILRVLDLKEWDHKQLTEKELKQIRSDICKLFMLKYLGLPSSIREVPKEIKDLEHLETLDVEGNEIVDVYREVIMVPNLKHLLGKFRLKAQYSAGNWEPKDCRLETFSGFVNNGKGAFPTLMQHMKNLKKVKMWCECNSKDKEKENKAKEKEVREVMPIAIQKFIDETEAHLERSLSIVVKDFSTGPFMESLNFPGKLRKFKLHGGLDKVPEFINPKIKQVGTPPVTECTTPLKVMSMCLSLTTLCGSRSLFPFKLNAVGATFLPSLKYLKLVEDELGPLEIQKSHFPRLVRMCLVGKKSIKGITIETGALEHLVSLHVICEHLDGLAGIEIGRLKALKEVALDSNVKADKIGDWKVAARGHPNKPHVLLIEAGPKP